jgi:small subunit ribosomal protein S20
MAHSKQALKRHRQNVKNRAKNRAMATNMKSKIKKVLATADAKDLGTDVAAAMKAIDKAAKTGGLHKNAAARYKSRVSRAKNRLAKAAK